MAVCDECGVENRDGAQFCSSCGAKIVQPEFLPPDKDNPFGLPNFGGNYPIFYAPTKIIPRRVRERLATGILKALLLPFLAAVVLIYILIHQLLAN
jgi:hypothetical protein